MKYALLIYPGTMRSEWDEYTEEQQHAVTAEYVALVQEPGILGAEQLTAAESATTVRQEDGKTLVTDGPFANAKEVLGGFYLLEADDIDRALEIASRMPAIRFGGAIEVRPVVER
jgi:hypothetical protein